MVESGRSQNNVFIENEISGGDESIKLKQSDGTVFKDNNFSDTETIRFDDATEVLMKGNSGLSGVELKVTNGACFDEDSDDDFEPTC